jgi:predicted nucleic acid-binding protein
MPPAVSNTSPLLYLHRAGLLESLPRLLGEVWLPSAVERELRDGQQRGYDVPNTRDHAWLHVVDPRTVPSEWLALDLGAGELAAMALALENPDRVLLLDDALARRIAQAAGLTVWGTLRVLLEAKEQGLEERVGPLVDRLQAGGMWISDEVRRRVLALAGEQDAKK